MPLLSDQQPHTAAAQQPTGLVISSPGVSHHVQPPSGAEAGPLSSEQKMRIQFNISSSSLAASEIRYLSSFKNTSTTGDLSNRLLRIQGVFHGSRATCVCVESRSEASSSPIIMLVRLERDMPQLAG